MHRMRRFAVTVGLSLAALVALASNAPAALLHPDDTSKFPDLSGGYVSGTQHYTAQTGQFWVENVPYALALGASTDQQYDVSATSDGSRRQTLIAQLNQNGTLNPNGTNLYELYGKVTIDGKTYEGLLLKGTPTAFGSLDLDTLNPAVKGVDMYDLDIKITDGLLKNSFGTDTYIRLTAERWSTFDGSFTHDFSGGKVASNIRGNFLNPPKPVPEPTTLVVILACGGAGLLYRRRRKIGRDDLETAAV